MKKVMTFLAVLLVIVPAVLTAGGQQEPKSGSPSDGPVALSVWAVAAAEVPVEPENIEVWKQIERKTNVKLDWQIVQTQVKDQQFNLLMAAGDLPDIISYYEGKGGYTSFGRFGEEGAFVPLEDLIIKYAPNLRKMILDDMAVRDELTAQDGHIYQIPMMAAIKAERGWFIRQDWLDRLGLKMPVTTDDLYSVLKAFKEKDPNGNGKADEIPLVFRGRGDDPFYNLGAFAYAFNADMDFVDRNGKVAFGPSESQYKDFLNYIHRLYSEKLIDQEILTRQGNARDELLGQNLAGGLHDWFASTASLNDKLPASITGFELKHFAPPLGTVKKPFTRIQMSRVRQDGAWAITTACADPIAVLKLFDYLYSDEGQIYTNFGIEGDTYTLKDGQPVYTDKIMHNPEGLAPFEALYSNGMEWKVGMIQAAAYERQFANAEAFAARMDYQDKYIVDKFPTLKFTSEENETVVDKYSQLRTYVIENTAKFMVGARSMSEFDQFQKELNSMGLPEVLKIYQAAYDRKFK